MKRSGVSALSGSTRFAIVGTQRTGTSLIRTSLSSHPDIQCHGEVFKLGHRPYSHSGGYWMYSRRDFRRRLQSILQPRASISTYLRELYGDVSHRAIGFKLMLSQCKAQPCIWQLLTEFQVKAVMVRRRNVLKTLISRRAAAATGVYHVSESLQVDGAVPECVSSQVRIAPDTLLRDLGAIEIESAEWLRRLNARVEFIEVVYENYVKDIAKGNREILQFLGVAQRDLHSDLEKVNPDSLAEVLLNYDEVEKTLNGTQYAYCLDDR